MDKDYKRNVLIIGATGTLGMELSSLMYSNRVNIIAVGRDEEKQKEYAEKYPDAKLIIADCGNSESVIDMFNKAGDVDFVIHCAAMKHVNICEENPGECARINVMGTQYIMTECVKRFIPGGIFISSDKSIEPIGTYGASKLMAERIWLSGSTQKTRLSVVRSGNMYGSRGSVIPFWTKLAMEGLDIPLTHLNMLRYWIEPCLLAEFIIKRAEEMKGGEIFIPDCELKSAASIAESINKKHGNKSKIIVTGLRIGEKLVERLFGDHEKTIKTNWGYIVKRD